MKSPTKLARENKSLQSRAKSLRERADRGTRSVTSVMTINSTALVSGMIDAKIGGDDGRLMIGEMPAMGVLGVLLSVAGIAEVGSKRTASMLRDMGTGLLAPIAYEKGKELAAKLPDYGDD